MAMTRRQIDASRERRLWFSQIVIPTLTLVVTGLSIPEVREAVKSKAAEVKERIDRRRRSI